MSLVAGLPIRCQLLWRIDLEENLARAPIAPNSWFMILTVPATRKSSAKLRMGPWDSHDKIIGEPHALDLPPGSEIMVAG